MDRTHELLLAVDQQIAQLPKDEALAARSSLLLKPAKQPSDFSRVALSVVHNIQTLKEFIKANQREYLSAGGMTDREKDQTESEVGLLVKAATQQIEQLKASVLAAQAGNASSVQSLATAPPATAKQKAGQAALLPPPPRPSPQAIAHLHGMVLIAAERLHTVCTMFDKCRAARYQQLLVRESLAKARMPSSTTAASGVHGCSANGHPKATNMHKESFSSRGHSANGTHAHTGSEGVHGAIQDQALQEESQGLVDRLTSMAHQATGLERSLREISTLHQMFSTAVLHQAEQIEHIYDAAVDATANIVLGNTEVVKTIAVNKSSMRYLLVLLFVATVCLLLFDWINS